MSASLCVFIIFMFYPMFSQACKNRIYLMSGREQQINAL